MAQIVEKIEALMHEHIELRQPLKTDVPLIKGLGFDSLDLIETSFTLQEFFEFDFSDKNPLEELDRALGEGSILSENQLTELGMKMVRKRMPELAHVDLPEQLTAADLQQYYTVETFARLIREFYINAPETGPHNGEETLCRDFKIVGAESGEPVTMPSGDELVDAWVREQVEAIRPKP